MPSNQPTQNDYWWRDVYYEDIHQNVRKPHSDRPSRSELFWQRQEPVAWLYELIRRSPEVKRGQLPLPGYGIWPPFPTLKALDQTSLLPKKFDWRIVESMDHVKGQGEPLSRSMLARKSEAKRFIAANRDALINAIQEAHGQAQDLLNAIAATVSPVPGSKLNLDDPLTILDILDESDAFLKSLSGQTDSAFADSVMSLLGQLQKGKQ